MFRRVIIVLFLAVAVPQCTPSVEIPEGPIGSVQ